MGKKGKDKKKGKGAEKTAAKTEKKFQHKLKKDLEALGEDDIETIVANLEKEEKKRSQVTETVIDKPTRRINFTFLPHPDKDELILFGGEFFNGRNTSVYNDLFTYNIPNNKWTLIKAPAGPPPRCGHQMVATSAGGGQLWLFGGEFASSTESQFHHYRDLWVYHLSSKKWEQIQVPNGPSSRSGHRMVISKNKIFLFGGFHDNIRSYKYFNDIYCFDISSYKWTKLEPSGKIPPPRSGCCMVALNEGKILIYGGYSKTTVRKDFDKGQVYSDAYILTPDKNDKTGNKYKWITQKIGGVSFSPRCSMPISLPSSLKSYCFGGVFDIEYDEDEISGSFFNDLISLDLEKLMWRDVTISGKKKEGKSRRRKDKGEGDDANDGSEEAEDSDEVENIAETVETTTIADDGIFKVTVGPAPVASQSSSTNPVNPKVFQPSPRINCGLAIKRGVLYLYGGMCEDKNKEITFNDFYSLDLHKLEEWKTIIADDSPHSEWAGSESNSEDDDEMDDDEEDEEDDDDEESADSPMECE